MSIINEALKKANQEKTSLTAPSQQKALYFEFAGSAPAAGAEHRSFNWGPLFILLVLLLIAGPLIAPFFSRPVTTKHSQTSPKPNALSNNIVVREPSNPPALMGATSRQFTLEETPLFKSSRDSSASFSSAPMLQLAGIVYSKSESYCLVNNKILTVGDSVRGAKIVKITDDEVLLDFNGQRITLRT